MFLFVTMSGRQLWQLIKWAAGIVAVLAAIGWLLGGLGIGQGMPSIPVPKAPPAGLTPADPQFCVKLNNHITTPSWQTLWDDNCMNNPTFNTDTGKYTNSN